ncbi:Imm1 family immunity protein [Saccharopolyspora sp. CA-218241]|uniref:Imm1 family immunity protein n=1 Tax=Saccharopolyspora sp. CA-218241 TaxID=3240027 RepID=UPI003D99B4D1
MTAIETTTVITVVFRNIFRYARTPAEIDELIDQIVTDPPGRTCGVYLWDRPCLSFREPDGPAFPDGRLRVTSETGIGWGALNYVHRTQDDGALVDSFNPDADETTPVVPFDPEGGIQFPRSASLPLDQVRDAVAEFCRTGARPTCVRWQPGEWF